MKTHILFLSVLLSSSLLITACGGAKEEAVEGAAAATSQPQGGQGVHPEAATWCRAVNATGRVEAPPQSAAVLHAPVNGIIKDIRHLPGDLVQKGERLAVLEHPDIVTLQEDFLAAGSRLHYLEQADSRNSLLAAAEAVPLRQQQEVGAERKALETRRKGLAQRLRLIGINPDALEKSGSITSAVSLLAPITGYLTRIDVTQGQFVEPATKLFALVDDSHMHLAIQVMAQDVGQVKEEQSVTYAVAGDSLRHTGTVHRVNHAVDRSTGSVEVHVHMDGTHVLPAGTFVNASICVGQDSVLLVPVSALQGELDDRWLWVQEGGAWKQQPVQIGAVRTGKVQIKSGVVAGATIWVP
jgi:membrane fusion protein, heavy metal efflux system